MLHQLKRTLDGDGLTAVANDPDVRPWLGGDGDIDLRNVVANPANFALSNEHGGFLMIRQEPAVYEVHSLFRKAGRGPNLPSAIAEGMRYMFAATDCIELQTRVPWNNVGADKLASAVGFRPIFERADAWKALDGSTVGVSYRTLTFDAWKAQDATIEATGHWFHEALEGAKTTAGSNLPTHPDDPAHDRAVGAAVLMAQAGNPRKAVWLYNRWARFAGYQTIEMLSDAPPVLDVRDAVVEIRGMAMEVLSCR